MLLLLCIRTLLIFEGLRIYLPIVLLSRLDRFAIRSSFSPFRAYGRLGGNIRQPSPLLVSSSPLLKIGTDAVLRCYLNMRFGACKRLLCYLFLKLSGVATSLVFFFVLYVCVLVRLYTLTMLCTRKRELKQVS